MILTVTSTDLGTSAEEWRWFLRIFQLTAEAECRLAR
jgi:hypothetical protein